MIIHHLPHQNNVQQIGYKLLSTLNFKGRRGEEVARTLISACLWNDSVESKSRAYGVSPQTVRNYVEEQGVEVVEKLLESARKMSLKVLKGVREIDLSIDWTTKTWNGKTVGGLGSSEEGSSWNYATATTKFDGKVLLLAFVTQSFLPSYSPFWISSSTSLKGFFPSPTSLSHSLIALFNAPWGVSPTPQAISTLVSSSVAIKKDTNDKSSPGDTSYTYIPPSTPGNS